MVWFLYFCAVIIICYASFAPMLGITTFSWTLLVINCIFAILFIALANILSNQAKILDKLDRLDKRQRLLPTEKKICEKCSHSYDIEYKSCPKCGYAG